MESFVVIHPENRYIDPAINPDPVDLETNLILFPKIARASREHLLKGNPVYYLADSAKTPEDPQIFEDFRPLIGQFTFLPEENPSKQFLRCKRILMETDPDQKITIAGISRFLCIRIAELLFQGKDCSRDLFAVNKQDEKIFAQYALEMHWTRNDFQKIYSAKLNAVVAEELTDLPLSVQT